MASRFLHRTGLPSYRYSASASPISPNRSGRRLLQLMRPMLSLSLNSNFVTLFSHNIISFPFPVLSLSLSLSQSLLLRSHDNLNQIFLFPLPKTLASFLVERQAQHRPDRLKKPRTGSVGTDRLGRVLRRRLVRRKAGSV